MQKSSRSVPYPPRKTVKAEVKAEVCTVKAEVQSAACISRFCTRSAKDCPLVFQGPWVGVHVRPAGASGAVGALMLRMCEVAPSFHSRKERRSTSQQFQALILNHCKATRLDPTTDTSPPRQPSTCRFVASFGATQPIKAFPVAIPSASGHKMIGPVPCRFLVGSWSARHRLFSGPFGRWGGCVLNPFAPLQKVGSRTRGPGVV